MGKCTRGNTLRFWNFKDIKDFKYVKKMSPTLEGEVWDEKSYGSMYDSSNPMPDWIGKFEGMFKLKNQTYTFYKMDPGEIMPVHIDHFRTYQRIFNVEYKNIKRVLVMLEDWKPGHYLEIDGVGVVNWVAGDWFMWDSDVPHSAANIGTIPRYTLQITGEVAENSFDAWRRLYSYNIPGAPVEKNNFFIEDIISRVDKNEKDKPLYIFCGNEKIKELETVTHDNDSIEYLNQVGITVYLYEPLSLYSLFPDFRKMGFYGEYHHKVKKEWYRADELDSLSDYSKRNKLNNITVKTGDYRIEEIFANNYPSLSLKCDDIFLRLNPNFPALKFNLNRAKNFTKKFICLNWRYTTHRHIMAAYIASLDSYHITWYYKADYGAIFSPWSSWESSKIWKEKFPERFSKILSGLNILNAGTPFNLDLNIKEPTLVKVSLPIYAYPSQTDLASHPLDYFNNDQRKDTLETFYNDAFVDVVTESRFGQPTGNYSEKTYQPMYYRKPFILVAPPHTLKYLKEDGFRTFSDFWDESYDEEEDHLERIFKILEVIDYINSKPIEDLQKIYDQMHDILEHNNKLFFEKIKIRK